MPHDSDDTAHRIPYGPSGAGLSTFRESLALGHRAVTLAPPVLANPSSGAVAAVSANALGLVIRVPAAAAAADVRRFLTLAHTWSSLRHRYHLSEQRGHRRGCYESCPSEMSHTEPDSDSSRASNGSSGRFLREILNSITVRNTKASGRILIIARAPSTRVNLSASSPTSTS